MSERGPNRRHRLSERAGVVLLGRCDVLVGPPGTPSSSSAIVDQASPTVAPSRRASTTTRPPSRRRALAEIPSGSTVSDGSRRPCCRVSKRRCRYAEGPRRPRRAARGLSRGVRLAEAGCGGRRDGRGGWRDGSGGWRDGWWETLQRQLERPACKAPSYKATDYRLVQRTARGP